MNTSSILKTHISITAISILLTASLVFIASVTAAPTVAPPNGNPTFPAGPQGVQGPQGPGGNQGGQGATGATGAPGAAGTTGIGWCSWYNGPKWTSHGWDGGCAWEVGAFFWCSSGRLTAMYRDNDGFYNNTNCNSNPHGGHSSHP